MCFVTHYFQFSFCAPLKHALLIFIPRTFLPSIRTVPENRCRQRPQRARRVGRARPIPPSPAALGGVQLIEGNSATLQTLHCPVPSTQYSVPIPRPLRTINQFPHETSSEQARRYCDLSEDVKPRELINSVRALACSIVFGFKANDIDLLVFLLE